MNGLEFSLKGFLADEAGYDLVEFALGAALAGSVAVVALRDKWSDIGDSINAVIHSF